MLKLEGQPKLKLTKQARDKVIYLCSEISHIEWSGVLVYSVQGNIKDVDTLVLQVEDILPMDIGNSASTGFATDSYANKMMLERDYFDKNFKKGTLHSHHNMSTFFSGVDDADLLANAALSNYYVSYIVNNRGDTLARIGWELNPKIDLELNTVSWIGLDADGEDVVYQVDEYDDSLVYSTTYCYYEMEVENIYPKVEVDDKEFIERVAKLKEIKKASTSFKKHSWSGRGYSKSSYKSKYDEENDLFRSAINFSAKSDLYTFKLIQEVEQDCIQAQISAEDYADLVIEGIPEIATKEYSELKILEIIKDKEFYFPHKSEFFNPLIKKVRQEINERNNKREEKV